jgi:leucyl aminopeptidase
MNIGFAQPSSVTGGTVVVGVLAEGRLTPSAEEIDTATGGAVKRALAANPRFKGEREQCLAVFGPAGLDAVVLVGLGKPDALDAAAVERVGGAVQAYLNQIGARTAVLRIDAVEGAKAAPAEAAVAAAEGALLRSYRFDKYRTKEKPEAKPTLETLTVQTKPAGDAETAFAARARVAEGVFFTRDLASEPPNVLYPAEFAERCQALKDLGVEVEVLDEARLRELGMNALLGVGQGSVHDSRLVVLQWKGADDPAAAPLAFVGKGVTFDSGGISIKPSAGMEDMKWDMGGAGVVAGLFKALAGRKAKVNAIGILGLVENMPSGSAQRPSDVVKSMSGQTIEVLNTDAEGRLVLADALWYAQDRFKPKLMVDLATLTGAVIVALGQEFAGLFATDDALAGNIVDAGKAVGEKIWHMPLDEAFDKQIDSDIADVKNIAGNRWGGAIIGGQFLKRFVQEVPWAHIDIAGVTWTEKDKPVVPKGATGFGVRALDRFVAAHHEG